MPQDSPSSVTNRHSSPPVTLPREPIASASGPADTTLGQPSVAIPGSSRARSPEGPSSAQSSTRRNVSSTLPGPVRGAGGTDRATKALGREIDRAISQLIRAKSPRAVASALKSLAKAQEKAVSKGGTATQTHARIEDSKALIRQSIFELLDEDIGKLVESLRGDVVGAAQALLGEDGAAVSLLSTIEHFAVAEAQGLALNAIQAEVGTALQGALRSEGTFDVSVARSRISNAFRLAEQLLAGFAEKGILPLSPMVLREQAKETTLRALAQLSSGNQEALLVCMSSADLDRLAKTAAGMQLHGIEAHLDRAIAEHSGHLQEMTLDACETFLSQAASTADVLPHDGHPPRVDAILHRLNELEADCALHDASLPAPVTDQLAKVRAQIAAALAGVPKEPKVARAAELRHIEELARQLQLGDDAVLPLKAAATQAHRRLAFECETALQDTLAGASAGDPAAVLRHLARLEGLTRELVDASVAMGGNAPRDRAGIASDVLSPILRSLEPEQLESASTQLQGDFGSTLLATLHDACTDDRSPPEALTRLTLVASQLEQLPAQIAATLGKEEPSEAGIFAQHRAEIPPRAADAGPLPLEMRRAVQETLGVAAPEHGDDTRRGTVNTVFRQHFEAVLAEPASVTETMPVKLPSGLEVSRGFMEDAKRRFDFRLPDGSPLIDYAENVEAWNGKSSDEITRRIDAGAQRLLELYEGDAQAVLNATSRAFQSSTAPLQAGAAAVSHPGQPAEGNPARLPDGAHGYPCNMHWTSEQSKSITFLRGAKGQQQLLVDYRHRGGALELAEPGQDGPQRIYLDPRKSSVRFRAHVEFTGRAGELRALGVPTYEVNLVRHAFQKPYPPPTMQTLFADDGFDEQAARDELEAHAAARGRGGVVPTVTAIDAFREEQNLEAAEAVLTANQPHTERGEKMQAAHDMVQRVTREQGAALVASFDKAVREQVALVDPLYQANVQALRAKLGWPKDLEPPPTYRKLLENGPPEAIRAFDAFLMSPTGCPEFVGFRQELEAFRRFPDVAGARALYERWVKPETTGAMDFGGPGQPHLQHEVRLNLRADTALSVLDAIDQVAHTPLDAELFDEARTELGTTIDSDLAPAFIADVSAGRA